LAQGLLFFIIGACSSVIRYELDDINFQSSENAHLRRIFEMADPPEAYGKAIAQQISNHRT
jgi:hypothetical protein